jgi:hypothetical protein
MDTDLDLAGLDLAAPSTVIAARSASGPIAAYVTWRAELCDALDRALLGRDLVETLDLGFWANPRSWGNAGSARRQANKHRALVA